ncbi:MAG: protein kinase [Balneolaceae bacterium]|nr:protein kinase [Balneolaceae bacterium]
MTQSVLHYSIEKKIGVGGMGSVYLAEDTRLGRKVALKFLSDYVGSDQSQRERLKTEARAAASLSHPNIAQVYAIEEEGDELFIVMEYLEGEELQKVIASGSLTEEQKIEIALQVAQALQAAHEKGVIHRDVKPGNIMIDPKGNARMMDFGLARIQGSEHITKTGDTLGTPAYMSPEQVRGGEIDERSDIWSYGVVLYELFTGERPFQGVYEPAILYAITENEPEPASDVTPNIPEYIERIIHRCLQKAPDERYQDIGTLIDEIHKQHSTALLPAERLSKMSRSTVTYTGLGLVILAVLALFVFPFSMSDWFEVFRANAVPSKPNVAILPIDNIGGDSTYQAICEGLHETLSGKVSQVERYRQQLSVIPASEVRRRDIRTAGKAKDIFGVNLAVMSSMQPLAGDSTRLIMNLVDVNTIRTLDSRIIDVPSPHLAALQNRGVNALMEMLRIETDPRIEQAIQKGDPAQPGASDYYVRGRAYLQRPTTRENIATAIDLFKRAVDQDSTYALAYAALGESYMQRFNLLQETDDVTTAKSYIDKALELNSELAPVKITQGLINRGTGEFKIAIQNFRDALEIDPNNAEAYRFLASVYEMSGQLDLAENTYKQSIELKPDLWTGYNNLGTFYLRNGRIGEAIDQFRIVTELTPDNYLGYSHMGIGYHYQGEYEKAAEMYEVSFSKDSSYAVASNLGGIKFSTGQYEEAARWYKVALDMNPSDYRLWGNLASACKWVPRLEDEAEQYFNKAIELGEKQFEVNANNPSLMSNLGSYYAEIGDSAKAVKYTDQALEMRPKDRTIKFHAANTYEVLGKRDEALHLIAQAVEQGYSLAEIENNPDLSDLIEDERFKQMVEADSTNGP